MAKSLEALGFTDVKDEVIHRLIVNVEGHNKTGKTNLALTAPGPVVVFNLDLGLEGVARKHSRKDHRIMTKTYSLPADLSSGMAQNQKRAEVLWDTFKKDFDAVCKNSKVRTIVWDSATEAWELARIAEFGKLTQVQPWHYGPLNAEFRKVLRAVTDTDKNLIVTHKMTEVYVERKGSDGKRKAEATGEFRRSGFKDMAYVVQVNLRSFHDDLGFGIEVMDCRQDGDLAGMELRGKDCTFAELATRIFPETDVKDWR
jgi:hypothetical protein